MNPGPLGVSQSLAHFSNNLMYSAITVYLLAFLAYCLEWAFGSRSVIARPPAGAGSGIREREPALAGAPSTAPEATRTDHPPTADGPGAAGSDPRADLLGRIAVSLTTLAFLLHLGSVVARGWSVQRPPWGNMYEFSTAFALAATGAYLGLLAARKNVRWVGVLVTASVLLTLGLAVTVLYTDSEQLVPALHSYWLWIHVSAAIVSGGVFHTAAAVTLLYLFRDRYEQARTRGADSGRLDSVWRRLPSAETLDTLSYRLNALVFPLWTFAIIAGSIWAEAAWGRYWGWDPKETWAFITWICYAGYLHARATAGWKGRRAAVLGLAAFAAFVFNYYGVNIFVTGLHSYAAL